MKTIDASTAHLWRLRSNGLWLAQQVDSKVCKSKNRQNDPICYQISNFHFGLTFTRGVIAKHATFTNFWRPLYVIWIFLKTEWWISISGSRMLRKRYHVNCCNSSSVINFRKFLDLCTTQILRNQPFWNATHAQLFKNIRICQTAHMKCIHALKVAHMTLLDHSLFDCWHIVTTNLEEMCFEPNEIKILYTGTP